MSTPKKTAARIRAALAAKIAVRHHKAALIQANSYLRLAQDIQHWKDSFRHWSPTFPQLSPTYREEQVSRSGWRLSPQVEQILVTMEAACMVFEDGWPDGWMMLADSGAETAYIVDLYTGRVYEDGIFVWPEELQIEDDQLRQRLYRQRDLNGYRYRFASVTDLLEDVRTTRQWEVRRQLPICIGIAGPSGFRPSLALGTVDGMEIDLPRREEYETDEDVYASFDQFVESGDWDWYQRQPPDEG